MHTARAILGLGVATGLAFAAGCASVPPLENPVLVKPGQADKDSLVVCPPSGPTPAGYAEVYERCIDALDDYFEVLPGPRHSGIIRTKQHGAPGLEQWWKPSSPSAYERLLATFQTIRNYAIVRIDSVDDGFRVNVEVYRETEIASVSIAAAGGRGPLFRDAPTGERLAELVDHPGQPEGNWYAGGPVPHRDAAFEQAILRKITRPNTLK